MFRFSWLEEHHDQSPSSSYLPTTTAHQHHHHRRRHHLPNWVIPTLVVLVGIVSSSMILAFGVFSARHETKVEFQDQCYLLHHQLRVALEEYELVAQWVRQVAHTTTTTTTTTSGTIMLTREQFRQAYEYVTEQVLQFGSIGVVQIVRNETQRSIVQNDTRTFLRDWIHTDWADQYGGFHNGSFLVPTDRRDNDNTTTEYAVVHFIEPIVVDLPSTFDWLDLDLLALPETASAIQTIRETEKSILTKCLPCFGTDSVVLLHPGIRMSWEMDNSPMLETLSLVEIRLDYLLFRVFQRSGITRYTGMFIFDSSSNTGHDNVLEEEYLAGAYHEVIDSAAAAVTTTTTTNNVDPDARVQDVYNAIVQNLTGIDANIWTISSKIDALKRAAVKQYTQPDGSLVIDGARFQPYQPPDTVANIQKRHDRNQVNTIDFESRQWTIVITGDDADYPLKLGYVILSAVVLVAGCCCLALWIYTSEKRSHSLEEVRLRAELEKTDIMVQSARQAAKNERELNDFIAHEVRNPLSAAISAATFVSARVNETEPLHSPEAQEDVREDIRVIECSLQFINDLLRNMLDIHRASSRQLALNLEPMDVLHDLLEPVAAMLYSRTTRFKVEVDCPENLTIVADKIRLKQVILNLGRNAAKFVEKGFIRFRAVIVEGKVVVYVEDSGPGIPKEKRDHLFKKFQESLDTLQQGTGIGLAVCQSIISLMGGSIELDENYDSQVEGKNCKGARFVVNLALEPISSHRLSFIKSTLQSDSYKSLSFMSSSFDAPMVDLGRSQSELPDIFEDERKSELEPTSPKPLPHKLKILFVDDDMILRKLFVRSMLKALPEWTVEQCSNGETSIRLADQGYYDIIFMDQYMASTDKQLLGTETVRALRSKGVKSVICGLSANDIEADFLAAGADAFMIKPFPGKPEELRELLRKLLKNYDPPFQQSIAV